MHLEHHFDLQVLLLYQAGPHLQGEVLFAIFFEPEIAPLCATNGTETSIRGDCGSCVSIRRRGGLLRRYIAFHLIRNLVPLSSLRFLVLPVCMDILLRLSIWRCLI